METIQGVQKGRQFQQFQYSNGLGGSDLQTAASGHGGYGHHGGYEVCCENGVDFGTLLALLGGKPERFLPYLFLASSRKSSQYKM